MAENVREDFYFPEKFLSMLSTYCPLINFISDKSFLSQVFKVIRIYKQSQERFV